MQTTKKARQATNLADNAVAKKVLEEIQKIEAEAKQKKLEQLESLEQVKANISDRMEELKHQLEQVENAIATITGAGKRVSASQPQKRVRRDLNEVRERLVRWLEGRKGEMFMAGDLIKEFPELEGVQISMFLRTLTQAGTVKTDASEGNRRMRYFV
ncbi:MAG: hypothetical protein FWD61_18350 [Phycisphaerales bacterium]|nr:hypothetical protein [Phycisphaerales bacterium]